MHITISIDPVQEPPHALNKDDIKALLAVVPTEWTRSISNVRLCATLPSNSRFGRPVILSAYSRRLNVCCRELTADNARKELLRELAKNGLNITTRRFNRLSAQQLKTVDEAITPLLEKLRANPIALF